LPLNHDRLPRPASTKLEALELFLRHGADPNRRISSRRTGVSSSIWSLFLLQTRSAPPEEDSEYATKACLLLLQYGADPQQRPEYQADYVSLKEFFARLATSFVSPFYWPVLKGTPE
jgi:hypothetical protein